MCLVINFVLEHECFVLEHTCFGTFEIGFWIVKPECVCTYFAKSNFFYL